MEALRVIFGQIQGDYINFTMAAVAAMLNFSAGVENVLSLCLEVLKNTYVGYLVDIKPEIGEIRMFFYPVTLT